MALHPERCQWWLSPRPRERNGVALHLPLIAGHGHKRGDGPAPTAMAGIPRRSAKRMSDAISRLGLGSRENIEKVRDSLVNTTNTELDKAIEEESRAFFESITITGKVHRPISPGTKDRVTNSFPIRT